MGLFNDSIADHSQFLIDADALGAEALTYLKVSGASRSIQGVVERNPDQKQKTPSPASKGPHLVVLVRNNATSGIASTEVDVGSDRITVARRYGETAVNLSVVEVIDHDAAYLRLLLR